MTEINQSHDENLVNRILDQKKLVFYGISTNPKDFSHSVYRELIQRGFEIYAINPKGGEVEGIELHHPLTKIPSGYTTAYIMVNPVYVEEIVMHCHEQGITQFWFHRGLGQGAISPEALTYCEEQGLAVVKGQCILMFLKDAGFVHRVHRWFRGRSPDFPLTD